MHQGPESSRIANSKLGLILGLSLGLGIPVLLIAIGGALFYAKKHKTSGYRMKDTVAMNDFTNRPHRHSSVMSTTF